MTFDQQALNDLKLCLSKGDSGFELLNYYKGVPFTIKAWFYQISEGRIFYTVQPPNSILLAPGMSTLLTYECFLDPIRALVLSFDILKGIVELGGFSYTSRKGGSRREVRLEPEKNWKVEIKQDTIKTKGTVTDLSMSGVGVNVEQVAPFNRGDLLHLAIRLPTGTARMDGKIIKISTKGTIHRLAIEFTGIPTEKTPLVHYIFERSGEIRGEVQKMYAEAIQLHEEAIKE
jgi:hypothetical protein